MLPSLRFALGLCRLQLGLVLPILFFPLGLGSFQLCLVLTALHFRFCSHLGHCRFVALLLFLAGFGQCLADGIGGYQGQVFMVSNVAGKQFVLADDPGDQFLIDLVLLFPETDFFGDRNVVFGVWSSHAIGLVLNSGHFAEFNSGQFGCKVKNNQ